MILTSGRSRYPRSNRDYEKTLREVVFKQLLDEGAAMYGFEEPGEFAHNILRSITTKRVGPMARAGGRIAPNPEPEADITGLKEQLRLERHKHKNALAEVEAKSRLLKESSNTVAELRATIESLKGERAELEKIRKEFRPASKGYLALIAAFPLRPIRSDAELEAGPSSSRPSAGARIWRTTRRITTHC